MFHGHESTGNKGDTWQTEGWVIRQVQLSRAELPVSTKEAENGGTGTALLSPAGFAAWTQGHSVFLPCQTAVQNWREVAHNGLSVPVCTQNPGAPGGSLSTGTFCTGSANKRSFESKNVQGIRSTIPLRSARTSGTHVNNWSSIIRRPQATERHLTTTRLPPRALVSQAQSSKHQPKPLSKARQTQTCHFVFNSVYLITHRVSELACFS